MVKVGADTVTVPPTPLAALATVVLVKPLLASTIVTGPEAVTAMLPPGPPGPTPGCDVVFAVEPPLIERLPTSSTMFPAPPVVLLRAVPPLVVVAIDEPFCICKPAAPIWTPPPLPLRWAPTWIVLPLSTTLPDAWTSTPSGWPFTFPVVTAESRDPVAVRLPPRMTIVPPWLPSTDPRAAI